MRTILCFAVAILFFISSFAQHGIERRDALLSRAANQRTAGYVTLGIGVATIMPGIIMVSNTEGLGDLGKGLAGSGLAIVGTGCIIASVFCFVNANKSERKANRINLKLNEPVVVNMGFEKRILPYSVGLGIPIN